MILEKQEYLHVIQYCKKEKIEGAESAGTAGSDSWIEDVSTGAKE